MPRAAKLLIADDYHARAAGLLLQSKAWDYDSVSGMPTRTHDAELARDELVQLAAGLNDLPIYAMAVRACDQSDDGGVPSAACNRISPAKWATMDPDNAAPWLEVAAAAHGRPWPTQIPICRQKRPGSRGLHSSPA